MVSPMSFLLAEIVDKPHREVIISNACEWYPVGYVYRQGSCTEGAIAGCS